MSIGRGTHDRSKDWRGPALWGDLSEWGCVACRKGVINQVAGAEMSEGANAVASREHEAQSI
jgi:hypothetical protein